MIRIRDNSGVLRNVTSVRVRDNGNVLRNVQTIRIRDAAGVLRTVFSAISATINGPVEGYVYANTPRACRTASATVSVTGGTGALAYTWSQISGDMGAWTIVSPNAASTSFETTLDANEIRQADFRCAVTDASGSTVSATVQASAYNYGRDSGSNL